MAVSTKTLSPPPTDHLTLRDESALTGDEPGNAQGQTEADQFDHDTAESADVQNDAALSEDGAALNLPSAPLTDEQRKDLARAIGLCWARPQETETIAAAAGVNLNALLAVLGTDEGAREGAISAEKLRRSGELIKHLASDPLESLIVSMGEMIKRGEVSPGLAPKMLDSLFRVTGIAEERAARLRTQTEERPLPMLCVLYGNDVASPPVPGQKRIMMHIPNYDADGKIIGAAPAEKVINALPAEVVEDAADE